MTLNREKRRKIEEILFRLGKEKICVTISFKVQPSLASLLKKLGNRSAFAREAVLEKLRKTCKSNE